MYFFQYFSPYLSADMSKMAVSFNTTVLRLEDELMQLILDGQINARIDSHSKVGIQSNEARCEKTGLRGFRPGPTQTGL